MMFEQSRHWTYGSGRRTIVRVTTTELPRAPSGPYLPGTAGYRRVMVAMFLAGMSTFVLLYDVQALLPELVEAYAVTPTRATLALSLTTAALALSLLVAGPVSEVVGRTRLIHLALWTSSAVGVACAIAPTWGWLLGLRMLQGVTLAGLPAVATAYLREELHPAAHGRAFGLYIGGTALGGMAGRVVTAPVADAVGWRWGLAAAAAFALVCAALVAWLLPASRHFVSRPAGAGAVLAGARAAVGDRALLALYVLGACGIGAMVAVFNALGFRLSSTPYDLSVGTISLVYLVYALGTVSSATSGRIADRIGRRATIPAGCALALVGVWLTLSGSLPVDRPGNGRPHRRLLLHPRPGQRLGDLARPPGGGEHGPGGGVLPVRLLRRLVGLRQPRQRGLEPRRLAGRRRAGLGPAAHRDGDGRRAAAYARAGGGGVTRRRGSGLTRRSPAG